MFLNGFIGKRYGIDSRNAALKISNAFGKKNTKFSFVIELLWFPKMHQVITQI